MRFLSLSGLNFRLPDGRPLLHDLTFDFGVERTGLFGANGIGKSLLLRILAGLVAPSAGSVTSDGAPRSGSIGRPVGSSGGGIAHLPHGITHLPQGIAYLPQDLAPFRAGTIVAALGLAAEWSAWQRVSAGTGRDADFELLVGAWDIEDRVLRILAMAELPLRAPDDSCATLSGGELLRLVLAGLIAREPDFLLLDEPTNHLDAPSRASIYAMIEGWTMGLIVVSHDRALLRRMDRIAELSALGLRAYGGNFDAYREQKEEEAHAARAAAHSAAVQLRKDRGERRDALERQQKRAVRGAKQASCLGLPRVMLGKMKRGAEQSSARLAGVHGDRVEASAERLAEAKARVEASETIQVDLEATAIPSRKLLVEAHGLNFRLDNGELLWDAPLDLTLRGAARLAIRGANGAGKSLLAGMLVGRVEPSSGNVRLLAERVAWLDQRVALLDDTRSVLENARSFAPEGTPEHDIRGRLHHFGFHRDVVNSPASSLSGGERMRAGLACILSADAAPQLLVLDEPTNNLDFSSLQAVEDAIGGFEGALIVISHDEDFLENVGVEDSVALARG